MCIYILIYTDTCTMGVVLNTALEGGSGFSLSSLSLSLRITRLDVCVFLPSFPVGALCCESPGNLIALPKDVFCGHMSLQVHWDLSKPP